MKLCECNISLVPKILFSSYEERLVCIHVVVVYGYLRVGIPIMTCFFQIGLFLLDVFSTFCLKKGKKRQISRPEKCTFSLLMKVLSFKYESCVLMSRGGITLPSLFCPPSPLYVFSVSDVSVLAHKINPWLFRETVCIQKSVSPNV